MTDLHAIANQPGFGSGAKAIEDQRQRDERFALLPDPMLMAELFARSGSMWGVPVATFGHCPDTDRDWQLEHESELGLVDGRNSTASTDAQVIAAVWNAYRAGDLVKKGGAGR